MRGYHVVEAEGTTLLPLYYCKTVDYSSLRIPIFDVNMFLQRTLMRSTQDASSIFISGDDMFAVLLAVARID